MGFKSKVVFNAIDFKYPLRLSVGDFPTTPSTVLKIAARSDRRLFKGLPESIHFATWLNYVIRVSS